MWVMVHVVHMVHYDEEEEDMVGLVVGPCGSWFMWLVHVGSLVHRYEEDVVGLVR